MSTRVSLPREVYPGPTQILGGRLHFSRAQHLYFLIFALKQDLYKNMINDFAA